MRKYLACLIFFAFSSAVQAVPQMAEVRGRDLLKSSKVAVSVENKKALVVVFLSAKCPCSNSHIDELKALANDYPDFSFVGVHANADEGPELSTPYFQKAGLPFPVIQDQNLELADRYRALKTPHAFVIKPDGKIAYQGGASSSNQFSSASRKYLREALEDIQNNRPVGTPEGRTLGCAISRGEKNVW